MPRKKQPSDLKNLKADPKVDENRQNDIRGGFVSREHGDIGKPTKPTELEKLRKKSIEISGWI